MKRMPKNNPYQWFLIFLFWLCSAQATIELPNIGTSANTVMSPAEEQKLGETFIRQLRRQVEIIDDLQVHSYINELGHQIASYNQQSEQLFHFFVIKEPTINAFAVPGGFIGLHSGLILNTRSESELAAVVAHEIAHVTQRHIARAIESSQRFSLPTLAGLIVAIIAGATANPEAGQAAVAAIMAGNIQMQINFTRTHETEADHIGMQLLAQAGFNPHDMPNFFERLQAASRYYSQMPEFLRTHPVTSHRIAEARDRAEKYTKKMMKETPFYHLMKAKLLVETEENPNQLLNQLKTMLKEGYYRDERATRYALALTLLTLRQTKEVQKQIDWLLKNDGDRVVYRLLQGQLASLESKKAKAMQIYERALQIYPGDQLLSLDYAEKLLHNKAFKKAKTVLQTLSSTSFNPQYYQLLAQAHQKLGESAEAHLALAESYYLKGETKQAVDQLKQARQQKDLNFYLKSRIEARYDELYNEWREEQEAAREEEPTS